MPIMRENPCADGHPELRLLLEVTSFADRLPVMHCNRCGSRLGFEDAVRNDERIKIAQAIEDWGMDVYQVHPDKERLEDAQFCARIALHRGTTSSDVASVPVSNKLGDR